MYVHTYTVCTSRFARWTSVREFRDVVFEDVVLDNNSYVTPYKVTYSYRIRSKQILLSNPTSSNTTSPNSESACTPLRRSDSAKKPLGLQQLRARFEPSKVRAQRFHIRIAKVKAHWQIQLNIPWT